MPEETTERHGIFICHSSKDRELAAAFSTAGSSVKPDGMLVHRKELVDISAPPDEEIARDIRSSLAMFVLIGPGLIELLEQDKEKWLHTSNWMSFEIGIALGANIDIWVVTADPLYKFPVLTFDVYFPLPPNRKEKDINKLLTGFLELYKDTGVKRLKDAPEKYIKEFSYVCPNERCKRSFISLFPFKDMNIYRQIKCPSCGLIMEYLDGKFVQQVIVRRVKTDFKPQLGKVQTDVTDFEVDD